VIAIALVVLGFIALLTAGIVIGVTHSETLIVFSTPIRADTRQVFLTGLVTGLALTVALWLFRHGVRRSRQRVAHLRSRRRRARHAALAYSAQEAPRAVAEDARTRPAETVAGPGPTDVGQPAEPS
jgi:ABC-type nickel/cobalt efflux system permease component RcnA